MSSTTPFRLNDWHVDPASDSISNGATCIKLDPRPMQVLVVLAQRAGEILSPRQIEAAVWVDVLVTTNSVYQCITQLRKALGDDPKQPQYIQTITRKGYRLIAKVEWQSHLLDLPATSQQLAADTALPVGTVPELPTPGLPESRRRRAFGLGALLLLLMAVSLGIEGNRIADARTLAQREHVRAEQLSKLMLEVFAASDPYVNLGRPINARDLLDVSAQRLDATRDLPPVVRAQMLETIGRAYRAQCQYELAVPLLEQALQLRRNLSGARPQTGSLLLELAAALRSVGRFAAADRAFAEAAQIRTAYAARPTQEYARLVADFAAMEQASGRADPRCRALSDRFLHRAP